MAGSRLANFGTIFSRVTGLLETGGIKEAPIWYDIYKKYPPELEPRADRPMPEQLPIPEIVYEEDFERVEMQKAARISRSRATNLQTTEQTSKKEQPFESIRNITGE